MYRSMVAGRRTLVVLDNARDAEHVRPLLPGSPTALTLVTSRNQLIGLVATQGAHPLALGLLPAPDARRMLARRLGDRRVADEPDAADAIVAACARLPLALAVAAARARQSDFPLRVIADELAVGERRLDALDTGDPSSQLRAVFSWSYATLTPGAARVFRLLGAHAGVDVGTPVVAGLTGQPEGAVLAMLTELVRANLIAEPTPGRYSAHDLLREYAVDRSGTEDPPAAREHARHRLLDHYVHGTTEAVRLLGANPPIAEQPRPADPAPGPAFAFGDAATAQEWLAVEHLNLLATIDSALTATDARVEHAFFLLETLGPHLLSRGHAAEWAPLASRGIEVARTTGNRAAEAGLRRHLTRWCAMRGDVDTAEEHARAAVDLYASLGHVNGRAWALQGLAIVHQIRGNYAAALEAGRATVAAFTAAGNVPGRVSMLGNLGAMHQERGEPAAAEPFLVEGLALATGHGLDLSAAAIGHNLANVYLDLGRAPDAIDLLEAALNYGRDTGDVILQLNVLGSLGVALRMTGRQAEAAEYAETRVALADRQDDLTTLAAAYRDRGTIRAELGDLPGAIADLAVALERAEESGDISSQIQALVRTAQVRVAAGEPLAATGPAERARESARAAGTAAWEAGALLALAAATMGAEPERAAEYARQALTVAPATNRHLEALAREAVGRALARLGHDAEANRELETAATIHRALGTCPLSLIY
jgi:tetratricopeptide (TPR) repeat protein